MLFHRFLLWWSSDSLRHFRGDQSTTNPANIRWTGTPAYGLHFSLWNHHRLDVGKEHRLEGREKNLVSADDGRSTRPVVQIGQPVADISMATSVDEEPDVNGLKNLESIIAAESQNLDIFERSSVVHCVHA